MVSSGTVNSDATTLNGYLTSYQSYISELSGSWKGTSFDSINSQAESFVSEYKAIVTQMNSFANACAAYEKYIKLKNEIAQTEADRANAADQYKSTYDEPLSAMNSDLQTLKNSIQTYLSEASSPSLTATAVSALAAATSSKSSSSSGNSDIAAQNKAFVESILSEKGKTIDDYPGFYGEWCAQFVSEMLNRNGYDIQPSAIAGYIDDGSIFKSLRSAGATVHLDLASQYHDGGGEGNSEYDPNYSPQPGDVVLFDFGYNGMGVTDHVGIVVQDNGDGTIRTIEGNTTGDAGDSCVEIKDRDRNEVFGYATPVKKSN